MAIASARVAGFENETILLTIVYNDANNAVQSATVTNNSPYVAEFRVWLESNPANVVTITVPPGVPPSTYPNLPGGTRYSPVELPEGNARATNFGYSFRTI